MQKGPAIARLNAIREYLSELPSSSGLTELTWDVLLVELELRKRSIRAHYFAIEAAFSVTDHAHTASEALPLLEAFLNSPLMQGSSGCARAVRAAVWMLEAEIYL